nr:DDE-type integrase/transposase/recombinase [Henriciella sp.]
MDRFGPMFAGKIRVRLANYMRQITQWQLQWHLDEVFVKINGETHYLWRAVDHEGEVLESYVTKTRDKSAALKFLRKAVKCCGVPRTVITGRLRSYGAAMKEIGNIDRHINRRQTFKSQREAALVEWRGLLAG